jgi:hypothetical protein
MGLIVSTTDFKGINAIATDSYTEAELDLVIDIYEQQLIYSLLGVELATTFIANLSSGVPTNPDYLAFYNAWYKEINGCQVISKGIKEMLIEWIFFYYVRTQSQTNTIQGNTQQEGSISSISKMSYATLITKYNDCIDTYKAIQTFIESEKATYPTYNGIVKEYMAWA